MKKLGYFLWLGFVAFVFVVALLSTGVRMFLYALDDTRPFLSEQLGQLLGAQVSIGRAVSEWRGAEPLMLMEEVTVQFDDKPAVHRFDRVSFNLDLFETLKTLTPSLGDITIQGGSVEIQRLDEGHWTLEGIALGQVSDQASIPLTEVHIRDMNVVLKDQRSKARLNFKTLDVDVLQSLLGSTVRVRHAHKGLDVGEFNVEIFRNLWGNTKVQLQMIHMPVGHAMPWLPPEVQTELGWVPLDASASIEAELDWTDEGVSSVAAHIELERLQEGLPEHWQDLRTALKWTREPSHHRLALEALEVDDQVVSGAGYVTLKEDLVHGHMDQLDLKQTIKWARQLGLDIQEQVAIPLQDIEGTLYQAQGTFNRHEMKVQEFRTRFEDLSFSLPEEQLQMAALNGEIRSTAEGLSIRLDSPDPTVSYAAWNLKDFHPGQVRAQVHGWLDESCCRVVLEEMIVTGPELELRGSGRIQPGEVLALEAHIVRAHLPQVIQWLPPDLLLEADDQWLRRAFRKGELQAADLRMRLPLTKESEDEFTLEVDGDLAEIDLDYEPGLPWIKDISGRIYMNGRALYIDADARIMNSQMHDIAVLIEDVSLMYLNASTLATGPLRNLPEYLQDIDYMSSGLTDAIELEGETQLDFALGMPLDLRLKRPVAVYGTMQLPGNRFVVALNETSLEEVQGTLNYSEEKLWGSLDAKYSGNPAQIVLATEPTSEITIEINLHAGLQDILPPELRADFPWLEGTADWEISTVTPGLQPSGDPAVITVEAHSTLEGIAMDLPMPLKKEAADGTNLFQLHSRIDLGHKVEADLRYDPLVRAHLEMDENNELSGVIMFGDEPIAQHSKPSVIMTGRLPEIDVAESIAWVEKYMSGEKSGLSEISELRIDRLGWGELGIEVALISADLAAGEGQFHIEAPTLEGSVTLPKSEGERYIGKFERVLISDDEFDHMKASQTQAPDPTSLPLLDLEIKTLQFGEYPLKNVKLRTAMADRQLIVESLKAESHKSHMDLSGHWSVTEQGQKTQLRGVAHSEDIHETLKHLNIDNPMRNGVMEVDINVQWAGAPYEYDFKKTQGTVIMDGKDGQIRQVAPELARVLALLNIEMIFDRLALDFDDVLRGGFTYKSAEGEFDLDNGNLYTKGVRIVGPSAQILIVGRIGVSQEDFDLQVAATPEVSVLLPIAAGAAAGPIGIAAAYLGNKLMEFFQAGIDDASVLTYKVTGPWTDPIIEEVPLVPLKDSE